MSKELYETKQFKLTSGEEVIAEVVQWNMDDETEIVVRKAMKLVMGETEGGNYQILFLSTLDGISRKLYKTLLY